MDLVLTPVEVRVLGCLVEKEATTPDGYPLSLNALVAASNQKTNRDPVMSLAEDTVLEAAENLVKKTLVGTRAGAGSRVAKYAHRLHDRLRRDFDFPRDQLAVVAMLFLRGPQTPGEIKTRCVRLHAFADTGEVVAALERLEQREDGPYVVRLERQPGQKESRYAHLFTGEVEQPAVVSVPAAARMLDDDSMRIASLETELRNLRAEVAELKERLEGFVTQFD